MVEIKILTDDKKVAEETLMSLLGTPFKRTITGFTVSGRDEEKLAMSIAKMIKYSLGDGVTIQRDGNKILVAAEEPLVEIFV